jgi:hypothetical protein
VSGYVGESEIFRAKELDRRSLEQSIMVLADESGILDGFVADIMHVLDDQLGRLRACQLSLPLSCI